MKMKMLILGAVVLLCASGIQAAVSVSPASIKITTEQPSTTLITYQITEPATPPSVASSSQGFFQVMMPAGPLTLETVQTTVSEKMSSSGPATATVTETLTIPLSVIKRALELGKTSLRYTRTFNVTAGTVVFNINLTSPGAVEPLNISRIRLYFENKRAEITVKRKAPGLKAFADINFTGKGLLKGYWQVDDRIIANVSKNLVYGKSLVIATPDMPSLPTFSEGTHIVKFVIQQPEQGIPLPKALYYVTPDLTAQVATIDLSEPFDAAALDRTPQTFRWSSTKPLAAYLVEFMEEEEGSAFFSAYTTQTEYTLPVAALKHYFTSPQPYFWRVKGFDQQNNVAGESIIRSFRLLTE
ncbi:MAG: hypothetical protein EHM45_05965 [Desulfobacteraceae bacterium]|nr:MAG: hypothetical protein EHM45_05965 [Desulfobacteraceae bacterium]